VISNLKERIMEKVAVLEVDVKVAAEGLRATDFIGTHVYNESEENIGLVDDLMIGGDNCVGYAILSIGGFLGLGRLLVAVRFDRLELGEDRLYLPGATRDALKSLPKFDYL
jgi:hypothetical protein